MKSSHKVIRGGSWVSSPRFARVALRARNSPGNRYFNLGLRLVRRLSPLERLADEGRKDE